VPRLLAALYDPVLRIIEAGGLARWRAEVLQTARGRVLEIGAGTGLNLPHYPAAVDEVVLLEPDPHMRKRLVHRVRVSRARVTIVGAAAAPLPFGDSAFDTVVVTLVLCTVPDVPHALLEMRRVLKPGGQLVFLEHVGGAEGSRRLRWQRWMEPAWRRVAGDCHLTRRTVEAITTAGFTIDSLRGEDLPGPLRLGSPVVRGHASLGSRSTAEAR
jgi:ubiquinone/menaquinone biosynthesis C-methylase UbiE